MELNLQQLRDKVKEWMLEIVGESPPAPAPQPTVIAGGERTMEVRVSPTGEVVVRMSAPAAGTEAEQPIFPRCYGVRLLGDADSTMRCYGPQLEPLLNALAFSPAEETQLASILQATGLSREALLHRLMERMIAGEASRFAQDIGLGGQEPEQ